MSTTERKIPLSEPQITQEQFIPDHVFFYVEKGTLQCYDGNKSYTFRPGEFCIARKNRLARYHRNKESGESEIIVFCFEEDFIKGFQQRHKMKTEKFISADTLITVESRRLIPDFIRSLQPYRDDSGRLNAAFENVKYEELLIILLQNQPELAGIFFDYNKPEKINLEEFMNRNFKFNVRIERFAFLTGRSLSSFKRDFNAVFHETPGNWLVQKRLHEAHFLIQKENKKASEIYLELGFEDLSHFSSAFKKLFGLRPTELAQQKI